jgi:hypothetical protein
VFGVEVSAVVMVFGIEISDVALFRSEVVLNMIFQF